MTTRSSNTSRRGTTLSLPLSSSNLSSSAHASSSTSNLTVGIAPHSRSTISVEEWERKAPLTELQNKSVNQVLKASEKTFIPLKFAEEPQGKSTPGTPTPTFPRLANKFLQQKESSRPGTPSTPIHGNGHPLHPAHPVQTPQQFYDWFALIDRSVAHSQEAHYRAHVASLEDHLHVCELLERRIDEIETEVDAMMEGWKGVEEGGKSLKGACERLLEERDGLVELVEDIGSHLEYFQELEHATRMLNHPGESLIFQADFLYMVERVDICIDFLKNHRNYREAEVYLLRFQQCMTRAMTLIKMNFVGSLRALSSEISKRLADDISPTAQHHLLYTRFKSVSTRVAPLLGELERRARSYPDELNALLAECHAAYLNTRKVLLVPRVLVEIRGLDPGKSDLVELTREGCGFLKQVCTDEWNLYREFFETGQEGLYQFLETICDLLYDDLRPRILHEPRLTVLCEVCTVLQALMVLDTSATTPASTLFSSSSSSNTSSDDEDGEDDAPTSVGQRSVPTDDLLLSPTHAPALNKVGKRLHISHLLQMVLQDAQTRLFFKAQSVIQAEIRHYVPKPEELAWPDVLVSAQNSKKGNELKEKESTNQIFVGVPSLQNQDTWYPTMKTTVWVLSQLHDFVKPAIFEDIAQEALAVCHTSLVSASENVRSRNPPASHLDGSLFLVRHLLILKEIVSSLDEIRLREESSGLTDKEKDRKGLVPPSARVAEFGGMGVVKGAHVGGGVTETLSNMLSRTTAMLPEGLFASLGVTRTAETDMRGVKMEIDHTLRKGCEDVISASANLICSPLEEWSDLVDKTTSPSKLSSAASNPAAPPSGNDATSNPQSLKEKIPLIHLQFLQALQRDLRGNVARVRLYLEDERTVKILLEHVVERVSSAYERWGECVSRLVAGQAESDVDVLSASRLREMLRDVCGDVSLNFVGYGRT